MEKLLKELRKREGKIEKEFTKALNKDNIELAEVLSNELDIIYNKILEVQLERA